MRKPIRRSDEEIPIDLREDILRFRAAMVDAQRVLVAKKTKLGYCASLYCFQQTEPNRARCAKHLKQVAEATARSKKRKRKRA